jgi:hypothetical protein
MSFEAPNLYELLPAIYRVRDSEQPQLPLKSLLEVFQEYRDALNENFEQLYDDEFIETCAEWAALYIGDLIGYRPLHGVTAKIGSPRAEVANTIRYRRRKGTASMLEQLARDVTGWNARVVEFFEWLGWNQYMQHTRVDPPCGGTVDLRDYDACERVTHAAGAFDTAAHTVDVRRVANGVGRYNIPNIGLFLWRLNPYSVTRGDAREVADGHYTFHPAGLDAPLFNPPETEDEITHLAEEINVPGALRRRILYDELEARRAALVKNETPRKLYFGAEPVLQVTINGEPDPVLPEELMICNLADWHIPAAAKEYPRADGTMAAQKIRAAVDPVLGRLTFPAEERVDRVEVNYTYGFSDATGGGPYDRAGSIAALLKRDVDWQAGVSSSLAPVADQIFPTLKDAVAAWNQVPAGKFGVMAILDSHTYAETLTADDKILIPEGSRLLMIAADWPEVDRPGFPGQKQRVVGQFVPAGLRPHLLGDLSVCGTAGADSDNPGELILNGVLIEGALTVLVGNLGGLSVAHCTLAPGKSELAVNASAVDAQKKNARLGVSLERSISGPVTLPETVTKLTIADSVIANGVENDDAKTAIDARHAGVDIERSTVFGAGEVGSLEASNCIFTGAVRAVRRQVGCVRFSYLPLASLAPRRYRCQPDLEIATQIDRREKKINAPLGPAERDAIRDEVTAWMAPTFTSTSYGLPGFAQLRLSAPAQIRTGTDDEAEMGAFHNLYQPQRETNLRVRLEEYLRCNLEAGIFYVT